MALYSDSGILVFLIMEAICSLQAIMIVGHGANSMTMEEARAKLCAEAK